MNKNELNLKSFAEYCNSHPQERFWQALRNWARLERNLNYIGAGNDIDKLEDTFYW